MEVYKRDHLVRNALESCEIAIVNNDMAFREMADNAPSQEEADETKHPELKQDTDDTKSKKKNKKNRKSKDKQKATDDVTEPNVLN